MFLNTSLFFQDTKEVKVNIVIEPSSGPPSANNSPFKKKQTLPAPKRAEKKISDTKKLKSQIVEQKVEKKKSITSQPTGESEITKYAQTYEDRIKTYEP